MGLEWYWWVVVGVVVLICIMVVIDVRTKRGIKEKKAAERAARKNRETKRKRIKRNDNFCESY